MAPDAALLAALVFLGALVVGLTGFGSALVTIPLAVPAGLLGVFVARRPYLRISRETLLRAVALILLVSGGSLVLRALH